MRLTYSFCALENVVNSNFLTADVPDVRIKLYKFGSYIIFILEKEGFSQVVSNSFLLSFLFIYLFIYSFLFGGIEEESRQNVLRLRKYLGEENSFLGDALRTIYTRIVESSRLSRIRSIFRRMFHVFYVFLVETSMEMRREHFPSKIGEIISANVENIGKQFSRIDTRRTYSGKKVFLLYIYTSSTFFALRSSPTLFKLSS